LRRGPPAQDWGFAPAPGEVALTLFYAIAAIIVGFVAVVWGADRFVYAAAGLAANWGVSRIVIGLTVVAFGTSAPEMLVSAMAALAGSGEMGIGNAVGSNVTNVTLVLGSAAIVGTLRVHSRLLRREIPILFAAMAVSWWFLQDGEFTRVEGGLLFAGLLGMVLWLGAQGSREASAGTEESVLAFEDDDIPDALPTKRAVVLFIVGLVCLLLGSRVLVWGGVELAVSLGVSELVIGLTLVALGTSLPELAASVAASRRGEHDIAVGNVVGSNIFNILGVLALPGIIAPGAVSRAVVVRDYPIMLGATLLLLFMAVNERNAIGYKRGAALVAVFVLYFVLLFVQPGFIQVTP
jgi:cation:H+ antiporter